MIKSAGCGNWPTHLRRERDFLDALLWDEPFLRQCKPETWEVVLRYLLDTPDVDKEPVLRKIQSLKDPTIQESIMTIDEQLIQEGVEKGRSEGRAEGRAAAGHAHIRKILGLRFGDVPQELDLALGQISDLDRLETLLEIAVQCPDLEAFSIHLD